MRGARSPRFLVLAAGYAYFAACYMLVQLTLALPESLILAASTIFFPLSALAVVLFFINLKKIMRGSAGSVSNPPSTSLS